MQETMTPVYTFTDEKKGIRLTLYIDRFKNFTLLTNQPIDIRNTKTGDGEEGLRIRCLADLRDR